jgi:hypothetical protein
VRCSSGDCTYIAAGRYSPHAAQARPPPLSTFDVFKLAKKAVWLATIEATDEHDAIKKVAEERNIPAYRLIATRR